MKKLFVSFATFQNATNVIPIIFSSNKGDNVLWIESGSIKRQNLVNSSIKVLNHYGIESIKTISIKDADVADPNFMIKSLQRTIDSKLVNSYFSI